MGLYFRCKDEVFNSIIRPYDPEPFEQLLKDYFTEDKVMTDIKKPKVDFTFSGLDFVADK